ncbi:DUF1257 domain-containing protein [Litorilinea aerophila]|uniref:DUF1257 domain-containing protein n=1 Tax=Litorilinea aerophila TaxID=1204385 RepID=A0A540VFX5_9CHLR|nr:DUF1257 domain-containing protein [Litorilinea aerophila]MCC9076652.1 DUF1257 domain-containing protein [Litorilinea aerophila]OUC06394.1 hypothetical protein RY27_21320 [Litorilinea aerophila]GIV77688.1 MAG: hypothetical protein KatS3mg050_2082 [Litorilinea sp.]
MSKFVKVKTELRDVALIKRALDDLDMAYQENAEFVHRWSGFRGVLPLVVRQGHVQFGLRPTDGGAYEVVGDDMQMATISKALQQLQQRYAYHKVLEEVSRAGFDLVEEKTGRDQVIRLTVRRWA